MLAHEPHLRGVTLAFQRPQDELPAGEFAEKAFDELDPELAQRFRPDAARQLPVRKKADPPVGRGPQTAGGGAEQIVLEIAGRQQRKCPARTVLAEMGEGAVVEGRGIACGDDQIIRPVGKPVRHPLRRRMRQDHGLAAKIRGLGRKGQRIGDEQVGEGAFREDMRIFHPEQPLAACRGQLADLPGELLLAGQQKDGPHAAPLQRLPQEQQQRRIVVDKGRGPQPHDRPLPCPAQGVQILPGIDQRNVRRFHDKPFLPNAGAPRRAEPVRPHRHRRHSAAWRFFDGPDAAPDARLPHAGELARQRRKPAPPPGGAGTGLLRAVHARPDDRQGARPANFPERPSAAAACAPAGGSPPATATANAD